MPCGSGGGSMPGAQQSGECRRWHVAGSRPQAGSDVLRDALHPLLSLCSWVLTSPGAFSSLGPGPGRASGAMFLPLGCRRGFPRKPGPWPAGPLPPHAHGPDEPPWEQHCGRGRHRWWPPRRCNPRPFRGRADFHGNEDRGWAPYDCPPPPPWDDGEGDQGPEDGFGEDWHPPGPWDPRPFPDPADLAWNEDEKRWALDEYPPLALWDNREDNQGPEDSLAEGWHPEPPLPGPEIFAWPEFPEEEQHPPWPPVSLPRERGGYRGGRPPRGYCGLRGRRCGRLRRGRRELTLVRCLPCPRPSRGNKPSSKSSPSCSGTSQPGVKEELQHPDPPQPLSFKDGAQSKEQTAQGPLPVGGKVLESPTLASTPQKSPAAGPQAATEAAKPEQAAGATPVELGAEQPLAGSHSQSPSALETEPVPPEESSARTGERREVEPCSQSVPEAGTGGGSHPHSLVPSPEPAERVPAAAGSAGEVGAELCPRSQGQQRSGAGEAKLLGGLQPSKTSQVLSGAATEPNTQPNQAGSDGCAAPATSPATGHPPGSGETEPAADGRRLPCSALLTPSLASTDLRSAAVLARKEEIELSYQQFSLAIAVVATMLLQKEPSMEAALGLALRANLRQGRIHHLQELEDFINSYDSATLSR
ncbi:uncharacterized protein LOC142364150 isoform X3 [Opisthocomus hoazin]|uniref:uncharacterized protein LOC142364150 isoform X3 n=1 Tax=Opisthocomus hoazin TaxID=30419 RepID=UPI003F535451